MENIDLHRWIYQSTETLWDHRSNSPIKFDENNLIFSSKKFQFNFLNKTDIPNFFLDDDSTITNRQGKFYNEVLFPNYDDFDDFSALLDKGSRSLFTKMLDGELPYNSKILELGCGTGQLSIYLSRFNRQIHGVDISKGSLKLGEKFRKENSREKVFFSRMNVFNLIFKKNYFDCIVSNGVLHHTKDAKLAFANLTEHLKPGGHIVIGLYHKYGRLITNIKQAVSPYLGDKIRFFDKTLRTMKNKKKKIAWKMDQFFNPHETSHTLLELIEWFDDHGIEYVNSIPFDFHDGNKLFGQRERPSPIRLRLTEPLLAFSAKQIREGGFFVIIGKKII